MRHKFENFKQTYHHMSLLFYGAAGAGKPSLRLSLLKDDDKSPCGAETDVLRCVCTLWVIVLWGMFCIGLGIRVVRFWLGTRNVFICVLAPYVVLAIRKYAPSRIWVCTPESERTQFFNRVSEGSSSTSFISLTRMVHPDSRHSQVPQVVHSLNPKHTVFKKLFQSLITNIYASV